MILIRKLKCRLGFHTTDLVKIIIQPVLISRWPELNDFKLPSHPGYIWKCKYCGKEEIPK